MDVKLNFSRQGTTPLPQAEFFDHLADIPATLEHFPKLRTLKILPKQRYRWELDKIGAAGIYHEVVFTTDFTTDNKAGSITFTAVPGVGNAHISGRFTTRQAKGLTHCQLDIHGTLYGIKVPLLLRAPAKPVIRELFENLVETFVDRIMRDYS